MSGQTFESVNPADTRDVVGRFQAGNRADVTIAIRAAREALPTWKATPAPRRGELLYRFGALMAEHNERLARAMTRYVNAGTTGAETHLPFGGWKDTGNGHREAGHAALDTFTEWKAVHVDYSGRLQRAPIDNQPS